jgi:hypothetical protein
MSLNEKQAAAWMAIGESIADVIERVTDSSIPDEVAIDVAWVVKQARHIHGLADKFLKTFPRSRGKVWRRRGLIIGGMMPQIVSAVTPTKRSKAPDPQAVRVVGKEWN